MPVWPISCPRACGSCPDRHERDRSSERRLTVVRFPERSARQLTNVLLRLPLLMTNHSMPCIRPSRACSLLRLRLLPQRRPRRHRSPMRRLLHRSMLPQVPIAPMRNSRVSFAPAAYPVHASNESAAKPVSETPSVAPTAVAAAEPPRQCPVRAGFRCDRWQRPLVCSGTGSSRTRSSVIDPVGVRGTARGYGAERFLFGRSRPHGCGFSGTSGSGCTVLRS